jgi:hypothetical protein
MFNSQFSILIRKEKALLALVEHLAIRHPPRMRVEHWELSIGQIPGRIQGRREVPIARPPAPPQDESPATQG